MSILQFVSRDHGVERLFKQYFSYIVVVSFIGTGASLSNISAISWWSVLLVQETGVPGENHQHVTSHSQPSSQHFVSSTPPHE